MSRLSAGVVGIRLAAVTGLVIAVALPWAGIAWTIANAPDPPTPSLRPEMVLVPAGTWTIGSPPEESERIVDERQHAVRIDPFAIAITEVTQAQYQTVVGTNPSTDTKCVGECPVETVSWFDAIMYCNALSRQERIEECYQIDGEDVTWPRGLECLGYRLPTEAEWEVAARAGKSDRYAGTDEATKVCELGNVADATADAANPEWEEALREYGSFFDCADGYVGIAPVAQFRANGFGLYDMTGNVWEWVWDWYQDEYSSAVNNPLGAVRGSNRVDRGGSFYAHPRYARVAYRGRDVPSWRYDYLGFRVARSFRSSFLPSYPLPERDDPNPTPSVSP